MRYTIIALASALSFAIAAPAFAQAPTSATKGSKEDVDYAGKAKQRFAAWQEKKRSCYQKAGLVEGKTFIVNPNNEMQFLVNDTVWLHPDKFDTAAVKACVKL